MALIEWNSGMSVQVAEIDKQHQKLIGLINRLHDAMKSGRSREVLGGVINELLEYTITHFDYEMTLLETNGFPGVKEHKKLHDGFVQKISDYKTQFAGGKLTLSIDVANFLSEWLKKHIMGTDRMYADFLNEKGIH